ncbi:hypothetical protein GCM10010377_76540 [Streptomyces viridiviolaceus]|nr:hypothetical protein GCM10010377_76540 [Streptomyces viridiviolaceus]
MNRRSGATFSAGDGMEHGGRAVPWAAVVAAGVVGVLAVAALALRPTEGLLHSGKGPLWCQPASPGRQ